MEDLLKAPRATVSWHLQHSALQPQTAGEPLCFRTGFVDHKCFTLHQIWPLLLLDDIGYPSKQDGLSLFCFPTTSSLHIPMDSHQTFLGFRLVFLVQLFHELGTSSPDVQLQRPIIMLEAHSLGGETIAWVGATYIRCMQTHLCLCPFLVYHLVLSIRPVATCSLHMCSVTAYIPTSSWFNRSSLCF